MLGQAISVHGRGGQTRGYIDIRDTMRCVELAVLNPPKHSEYRVFNQITQQFTLTEIATKVAEVAGAMGITAKIDHLPNPRVEAEEHHYHAIHTRLEDTHPPGQPGTPPVTFVGINDPAELSSHS